MHDAWRRTNLSGPSVPLEHTKANADKHLFLASRLASSLRMSWTSSVGASLPMKPDVMTIVQHLSRYLRIHPDACDTSEGIARWWIDVDPLPVPVTTVETALSWMSSCGVVEALHAADGRIRYRRTSGADDVDAKLDALMDDPQAVMPPGGARPRPPRMH